MSHIDDNLKEGEVVAYRTGLHWAMLGGPLLLLILAGLSIPTKGLPAIVLLSIATLWAILSALSRQKNDFVITNRRVLIRRWLAMKRTHDIPFTDIVDVEIYQPSLGKVLNFGKLIVHLPGRKRVSFRLVNAPFAFLMKLQEQVTAYRQEHLEGQG